MSNEYKDMLYDDMYDNAFEYAYFKHLNQRRKWTDERYINHPINVQQIMCEHMNTTDIYGWFDRLEEANIFSACLLHDTVEDTDATFIDIEEKFGIYVRNLVYWLTNVFTPEMGNRAYRKKVDLQHILQAPIEAICIKLADVIDNCSNIVKSEKFYNDNLRKVTELPSTFSEKYLKEKKTFLKALWKLKKEKFDVDYEKLEDNTPSKIFLRKWLVVFNSLYNDCQKIINEQIDLLNNS